jgi:hypothetical protein
MSRPVLVLLGLLLVLVLLVAAAGGLVWWKIGSLKAQLIAGLGKSLGADVQVGSLDLDPWTSEIHAAGIALTNQRSSQPWEKADIAQATIRYHLRDLFLTSMPLSVELTSWNLTLHSPLRTAETPPSATADESESAPPSSSHRFRVAHLSAHDGAAEMDFADDRKVNMRGIEFDSVDDGGGVWTTQLEATSIQAGTLAVGASSVSIRGDADKLTFSDLRMQCPPGVITGEGEVATGGAHAAQLTLKAVDVPVTMLVAIDWQTELSGLATLDLHYTGDDQGGNSQGSIAISHGKFNLLPWLGKVTTLVGLPDMAGVEVDKATTDFTWKDGVLHLTNIDVRKTDVTRIAGGVDVDAQGNVDGKLKLGLPSAVTAKWPQLQASIFPIQFEDYSWADVHLTGTASHLQEDLTPRLLAAGLNQGGSLINQATQKAGDLLNSLLK